MNIVKFDEAIRQENQGPRRLSFGYSKEFRGHKKSKKEIKKIIRKLCFFILFDFFFELAMNKQGINGFVFMYISDGNRKQFGCAKYFDF